MFSYHNISIENREVVVFTQLDVRCLLPNSVFVHKFARNLYNSLMSDKIENQEYFQGSCSCQSVNIFTVKEAVKYLKK